MPRCLFMGALDRGGDSAEGIRSWHKEEGQQLDNANSMCRIGELRFIPNITYMTNMGISFVLPAQRQGCCLAMGVCLACIQCHAVAKAHSCPTE
jgi:hypothetical protein